MSSITLDLVDGFWRFPNNKVWFVEAGMIGGTIKIDLSILQNGLDEFLDHISEVTTGSIIGLQGISWELVGKDKVLFDGAVDLGGLSDDEYPVQTSTKDEHLDLFLKVQYGLSEEEAKHAVEYADAPGGMATADECVVQLANGKQLRTNAHPTPCSYIRVVIDRWELAYWSEEEFAIAPTDVLGAMMGAASSPAIVCS